MRKRLIGLILFLLVPSAVYSLENDLLNLNVPTQMERNELALIIRHRFYGDITDDPIGNHLGIDYGANIGLRIRYDIWNKLELKGGYTVGHKEYTLGSSYSMEFDSLYLRSQIDIEYFDYTDFIIDEDVRNLFYLLSIQSDLLPNLISLTVNVGYDAENSKIGLGFGVDIGFNFDFNYIQRIHLIAEYFPLLEEEENLVNTFAFGIKAETFGHLFMFSVGNNTEIGTRRSMLGAASNTLHFGFNIYRFISL
ncbi:MAG: DUF5777 family beta-barrel protein [candidate division WOR-3 bacterium]